MLCERCNTEPRITPENSGGKSSLRICYNCLKLQTIAFWTLMGWDKWLKDVKDGEHPLWRV
jgi:hypothetical protein